jgi:hypothetical protein
MATPKLSTNPAARAVYLKLAPAFDGTGIASAPLAGLDPDSPTESAATQGILLSLSRAPRSLAKRIARARFHFSVRGAKSPCKSSSRTPAAASGSGFGGVQPPLLNRPAFTHTFFLRTFFFLAVIMCPFFFVLLS